MIYLFAKLSGWRKFMGEQVELRKEDQISTGIHPKKNSNYEAWLKWKNSSWHSLKAKETRSRPKRWSDDHRWHGRWKNFLKSTYWIDEQTTIFLEDIFPRSSKYATLTTPIASFKFRHKKLTIEMYEAFSTFLWHSPVLANQLSYRSSSSHSTTRIPGD